MNKKFFFFLAQVFVLACFLSGEVYSFVHGGLAGGYRSAMKNKIGTGSELRAFVHIDPIPLVPVSVGASYSHLTLSDVSTKNNQLGEFSLESSVWLPISLVSLTPYLRARVPVYSFFVGNEATGESKFFSGIHGSVGIRWEVVPLLSIFVEGGMGFNTYKLEGKDAAGAYSVLGGLQVGV